ncbi:MAG: phage tail tape measure protein [Muribaculaceae bacterium]|nr:phage tail tape measure protein [Muribaculaceae bacterium]
MAKLSPDKIEWILSLNATQAQQEIHKLEKSTKSLQKENKQWRELMAKQIPGSPEWKKYNDLIKTNNKLINRNRAEIKHLKGQLDISTMTMKQLNSRLKELKREFENTSKATDPKRYKQLREEMKKVGAALDKAKTEARGAAGAFFNLAKMKETLTGFFFQIGASVLTLVTGAFRDAFNIVVDFEKENSRLAAILGTTRDGIKDLTAAARQLGATTSYSAAEVTQLQIELAKLGFAKQEIIDMEGAVLKFATAVGTDLARASAFTGAALRIFGKDASQAEDVLASFAVATTRTALDFSKLETSLSIVGPVAASFGLTLEDTTALLGQLANAGFDASSAATAARNILLSLADANGDLAKALGQPAKSAEGLAEGLKKLNAEGVDLAKVLDLTDKRSASAFSIFLDNAGSLVDLKESITNVNAEFNAMSDTMSDNVAGAMAGLRSAAEELVLKISEGTTGPIKDLINGLTSLVRGIGDVIQWMQKYPSTIKTVAVAIGAYKAGVAAATLIQKGWTSAVTFSNTMSRVYKFSIAALHGVMRSLRTTTNAATVANNALSASMKSAPWGAILGLISLVITAIISFKNKLDEAAQKMDYLTEKQKNYNEAMSKALAAYETEKDRIQKLVTIQNDENQAKENRLKAINELNKIIPGYNALLDEETGKVKANTQAMNDYLSALRKKLTLEANRDHLKALLSEDERKKRELYGAWEKRDFSKKMATAHFGEANKYGSYFQQSESAKLLDKYMKENNMSFTDWYEFQNTQEHQAVEKFQKYLKAEGIDLGELEEGADLEHTVIDPIKEAGAAAAKVGVAASETVDKIKELKARLKELRKMDPETDAEYEEIEAEKKKIQKQLKELKGTSSTKKKKPKHEAGTYREDSIDEATAPIDDRHQKAALDINKLKGEISETELAIKKNQELIRYCRELTEALDKMREGVKENHARTLDKITKEQNGISATRLKAEQDLAKALAKQDEESHKERLAALTAFHEGAENRMKESVLNREITQQEADIFLLSRSKAFHED